jgi:DNA polymerase III subunit epsilon
MKTTVHQNIDDTDFVVVDVETTGLSTERGDRVCEVAAVKLRGGAVVESFTSLIDPCRPISAGAYAVNKISLQMLADAPEFTEISSKFHAFIQHSAVVAYNAPFDVSFLNNEFRLSGHSAMTNTVIDALAIARQLLPGLAKYPQENVARVLGIPFPVKHRAFEDVMVTAKIFSLFSSILKAYDLVTVADMVRSDIQHQLRAKRLQIVEQSLSKGSNIWIKYLSPAEAEITDRVVTPKELAFQSSDTKAPAYLLAYCHSAKGERNFRIDRILDIRLLPQTSI